MGNEERRRNEPRSGEVDGIERKGKKGAREREMGRKREWWLGGGMMVPLIEHP